MKRPEWLLKIPESAGLDSLWIEAIEVLKQT